MSEKKIQKRINNMTMNDKLNKLLDYMVKTHDLYLEFDYNLTNKETQEEIYNIVLDKKKELETRCQEIIPVFTASNGYQFDEEMKQAILKTYSCEDCNKQIDSYIDTLQEAVAEEWPLGEYEEIINNLRHYRACYELVLDSSKTEKVEIEKVEEIKKPMFQVNTEYTSTCYDNIHTINQCVIDKMFNYERFNYLDNHVDIYRFNHDGRRFLSGYEY